jgi:hypothetical protein
MKDCVTKTDMKNKDMKQKRPVPPVTSLTNLATSVNKDYIEAAIERLWFFKIQDAKLTCTLPPTQDNDKPDICKLSQTEDNSGMCKCGDKAICFWMPEDSNNDTKAELDGGATRAFLTWMQREGHLGKVFESFRVTMETVIMEYAKARGLVYGRDIVFYFKGGNVLKWMLKTLFDKLELDTALIQEKWNDLLQLGDLDFEIHLQDPNERRIREVCILIGVTLTSIRRNYEKFLPEWKPEISDLAKIEEVLSTHVQLETSSTRSDSVVGTINDVSDGMQSDCKKCQLLYMPVPRILRVQDKQTNKWFWYGLNSEGANDGCGLQTRFPISYNLTLGLNFKGHTDARLLRLRRGAEVLTSGCRHRVSAEVIDVSVPGPLDAKHKIMHNSGKLLDAWFMKVNYETFENKHATLYVPTLENLMEDLIVTLFVTNARPWLASRMQKRLSRWVWIGAMLTLQSHSVKETIAALKDPKSNPLGFARIVNECEALKNKIEASEQEAFDQFTLDISTTFSAVANTLQTAKQQTIKLNIQQDFTNFSL